MMQPVVDIELQLCHPTPKARVVDPATVAALAASIAECGLLTPIIARKVQKSLAGRMADAYEVVAGLHRVKAFGQLGRETIPAIVFDVDDLHAELMLIDENLCRNDLTPAERAAATARRKAIYVELHPNTAHGGDRKSSRQVGDLNDPDRFTETTSEATGRSERAVQRDARRGEVLGDDALAKVARTSLDKGEELDALVKLPPEQRQNLIDRAAKGEEVSAKSVLVNGARAIMGSRKQPDDDLDYSPTPPSATRALIECVFPTMNISHESLTSVHEPACGEGHMAEVLREFFPVVIATDIHDYGYGDAVQDFLDDKFEVDAD
jgi:ParB-like chromosome segregation protein Spo0J